MPVLGGQETWTYDNLNRMTVSPYGQYTNDIVGNRTAIRNGPSYNWDVLNRLVQYGGAMDHWKLGYRGDGMRVWKERWGVPAGGGDSVGGGSGELDDPNPSIEVLSREVYKYDGQMIVQQTNQVWTQGQPSAISHTQFVPGLRGVECSFTPDGKVNWFLYDGHGSVVATVDGLGTGQNWGEVRNVKHFDVWGNQRGTTVRGTTGQPTHGYCGNLGHTKDADLGNLIYMRARYYEPWTARFLSEDPGRDGVNWYAYARANPVAAADPTGRLAINAAMAALGFVLGFATGLVLAGATGSSVSEALLLGLANGLGGAVSGALGGWLGGGAGAFVGSVLSDLAQGNPVNWKRAMGAAGIGGVFAAVMGVVAGVMDRQGQILAYLEFDNEVTLVDALIGINGDLWGNNIAMCAGW